MFFAVIRLLSVITRVFRVVNSGVLDWEAFAKDNETRSAVVSIYRSDDSSHALLDVLGVAVAFQHGPVLVLHALAMLHYLAGVAIHSSIPMSSYLFGCCHLERSDCLGDEDQLAVVLTPVSANSDSVEQFTQPTEFVGLVHSSPKQLVDALHVGLSGSANARHLLAYTSKEQCSIDEALDYEWAMHLSARLLTRLKNGTFSSLSQQSDAKGMTINQLVYTYVLSRVKSDWSSVILYMQSKWISWRRSRTTLRNAAPKSIVTRGRCKTASTRTTR